MFNRSTRGILECLAAEQARLIGGVRVSFSKAAGEKKTLLIPAPRINAVQNVGPKFTALQILEQAKNANINTSIAISRDPGTGGLNSQRAKWLDGLYKERAEIQKKIDAEKEKLAKGKKELLDSEDEIIPYHERSPNPTRR